MDYRDKPLLLVIFGITGDLAYRKLLPALYSLRVKNALPEQFRIVGVSRKHLSSAVVYQPVRERLAEETIDEHSLQDLIDQTEMVQMDLGNQADYLALLERLRHLTHEMGAGANRMYYLSIPAQAFATVVENLGATGHDQPFHDDVGQPRLLVEKPFGHDMASAKKLIEVTDESFGEQQIFRIDHYLAKETAQNLLTFRFHNPLFQSIWNSRYIQEIRISSFETIGIEGRVGFYEQTGAGGGR